MARFLDDNGLAYLWSHIKTLLASKASAPISAVNVSVAASEFVSDSTYSNYPYRATVAINGVTANMIPDVTFSLTDATSGVLAPVAACYAGGIYIYASEAPGAAVTIESVLCWE